MVGRQSSSSWIVGVVCLGLGVGVRPSVPSRGTAVAQVPASARSDLDTFSDAQLDRDLQDELDDVFEDHAAGDVADVATIQEAIMDALSDASDEGAETEISFADLETEMHEDDTDVAAVVHDAIERLDHAALERPTVRPTVHLAVWRGASDPGYKPSYGLAVRDAKRSLIREIRKTR